MLVLPLHWLLAAVTAAAFHELCHLGAVHALGGRVLDLRIGPTGAVMETEISSPGKACIAALAGPAGSFLLLGLGRAAPHIAVCGLVQGLFNLLPIYPLDGGRVIRLVLEGRVKKKTLRVTEGVLAALTAAAALRFSVKLAVFFLIRSFLIKIPCKQGKFRVQ